MTRSWRGPCLAAVAILGFFVVARSVKIHSLFRPNYAHMVATVILALYVWGFFFVRDSRRHVRIMSVGILLDLSLMLYHEVVLRAMSAALGWEETGFEGSPSLLRVHVWAAVVLLVMYLCIWLSGRMLVPATWLKLRIPRPFVRAQRFWKEVHWWVGVSTITCNALSWATAPYFFVELAIA